jgi:cysteine-rich repeat protein
MHKQNRELFMLALFLGAALLVANFFGQCATAANSEDVIINEVAWMGTSVSTGDEWIELKNLTGSDIDLTGWSLDATDGTPSISLSGIIEAGGYFLLERTDDYTVPNIVADQIYTGALSNSSEELTLKDDLSNVIDSINALSGWPAGDSANNLTMEICDSLWQDSQIASGTPYAANSCESSPNPETECGNDILESGEECDDGNTFDNDGCSAVCIVEFCGDSIVNNSSEVCDNNSQACDINGYTGMALCNTACDGWQECVTSEYCGDDIINGTEECDDGNNLDNDGCSADCTQEQISVCGNDIIESGEECDNQLFNGLTCSDYGFNSGNLLCSHECEIITDSCVMDEPENTPKMIKEDVLSLLKDISLENNWTKRRLKRIIKLIERSLAEDLWQDESHLDPKRGRQVFIFESLAVLKMKWLLSAGHPTTEFKENLVQAITGLVAADKLLAQAVLDEAKAVQVKTTKYQFIYDWFIEKAQEQYDRAIISEVEYPRRAIYFFRKTWEWTQKAIKVASL